MAKLNRKALIVSLIFTLVSGVLLFYYISTLQTPETPIERVSVPVSARDIKVGEIIGADDISTLEVEKGSVPPNILILREEVEGKYAATDILAGEFFRTQRLTERGDMSLAFNIEPGYRAVSVFIDESHLLSMQLQVGDRVDVLASWTLSTKAGDDVNLTKTVLQNIKVLSLGENRFEESAISEPNAEQAVEEAIETPETITLELTLQDAETLVYNTQFATFSFALRGRGDEAVVRSDAAILTDMIPRRLLPYAVMPGEAATGGVE